MPRCAMNSVKTNRKGDAGGIMGMVKKILRVCCLFVISSTAVHAGEDLPGWEMARDKDGIRILTHSVEGSKFKEFQATATIKGKVSSLVTLYFDTDKCSQWLPDCKSSYVVEKFNANKINIYSQINNPWPIKNRDYVLQNNITQTSEAGEVLIEFEDVKEALGKNKCCTRMAMVKGFWRFTPMDDGYVLVTYQYHFDPGGDLPPSLVNTALPDLPFETLSKMKHAIEHAE